MKFRFIHTLFLFCTTIFYVDAQNENSKWYFGFYAGLDFSTNPPTILTNGALNAAEGCASVASSGGAVLFYTNGQTVKNGSHANMANGTGLLGDPSTSQSSVILKRPGSPNLYYIFHLGAGGGSAFYYSAVDMNLAANSGSVVTKNVLLASGPLTEQLSSVRHFNGTDFWVMVHNTSTNVFRAFLLTSAGVNTAAVTSTVGTSIGLGVVGCMKFSPNGTKLGFALATGLVELFDFNAANGIVSNPLVLSTSLGAPYGVEFSSDGSKFYTKATGPVIQWDLCAGASSAIPTATTSFSSSAFAIGSLQLANNGKIYVARYGQSSLGVINNPNLAGTACNYVDVGQSIAPNTCEAGLPNFFTSAFRPPPPPFTYTFSSALGCQTATFSAANIVSTNTTNICAFTGFSVSSVQWNFGDPLSGAANTSTLNNPIHYFASPGTYSTYLVVSYSSGGAKDTVRQTVNVVGNCPTVSSTSISCATLGTATITAPMIGGPFSYTWMPSAQTGSLANNLAPGSYTITCFDSGNNVTFTIGATFNSAQVFSASVSSTSLLACNGINTGTAAAVVFGGSAVQNYLWTNGTFTQTAATATALGIGIHTVTITDAFTFCSFSQTFQINQPPPLNTTVSATSPSACVGVSVGISVFAIGGTAPYTYSWTGGNTNTLSPVTQTLPGSYVYTNTVIDFNNCVLSKTIGISFVVYPVLSVNAPTICPGRTATLNVSGATTYTWLAQNINTSSLTVSPMTNSIYAVSGQSLGCVTTVTASVFLFQLPTLSFNTFSITCASLGSATVFASGGTGPFSYTWAPTLQTNSVAVNLSPGTYTLTVLDLGTSCTRTSGTTFNSLIPLSGTLVNTNSLTCFAATNGTAAIQNIGGGSANQNYFWTNGAVSYTNTNPTNLSAGTWSIALTDALTACQVNSVFTITQPPALTITISGSSPTVCAGNPVSFTATGSGGTAPYTFSWTSGSTQNTNTFVSNAPGINSYPIALSDSYTCGLTNFASVSVIPNPVLSVVDVSICPLNIGTLTASGASAYTWSSATNTATGISFTNAPTSSSEYTVVGSALGCTSVATASIILYALPIPLIQSNSPRCEGTSAFIDASGGSVYQWSGPSGFNSVSASNNIPVLSLNQAGVYDVTVTSVNGCTAATSSTLLVNPIPTVATIGSTVCTTQTLSLSANSFAGASFLWSGPLGFSSTQANPGIFNPTLNRTGTYFVNVTSVAGCTNMATALVSVISPPTLSLVLSSASLCNQPINGSPNTITLTALGANTYSLYASNLAGISAPVGSITPLSVVPPFLGSLGIRTATLEGSNGVCSSFSTFSVTVIPNPTVSINSYSPVICVGQNTTYIGSGASSYSWSSLSQNYSANSNSGLAVVSPTTSAVFSVIGASLGCLSPVVSSSITVNPLPTLTLSAASKSICLGDITILTASGSGDTYLWSPFVGINNNTTSTVVASPLSSQYYTVVATTNNCTTAANIDLTVLPVPQPSIIALKDKVCINDQIQLEGAGGVEYQWRGPMNINFQGLVLNLNVFGKSFEGQYTLTATDFNGCKNSTTTTVEVLDQPTGALIDFNESVCAPYCNTFTFKSTGSLNGKNENVQSTWSINNNQFSGNQFFYCFYLPGTYAIKGTITDQTTSCRNNLEYQLKVNQKPEADFIYSPLNPVENLDEVIFTNTSKGEGLTTFSWYFNNNKGFTTNTKNANFQYDQPGTYLVVMLAANQFNCIDTVIKTITVEPDFSMYVPNAFTPNSDNRNEVFKPVIRSAKMFDLKIYNRWGELIFKSNDIQTGWDGSHDGKACKEDLYTWRIQISSIKGEKVIKIGTVMLLRNL
jgi:gliding motility-associated-like protein